MLMLNIGDVERDALRLGVQANTGKTEAVAHWKAHVWAPRGARSYDLELWHTDYHGNAMDHETGYASCRVVYYTTAAEGQHLVQTPPPDYP